MANSINLQIITPEKVVYSDTVDMVNVPAIEGEIGILPNHIPLFTKIKPGEIKIKKQNSEEYLAITGGFINVQRGKVTILADYAIRSEDIQTALAEEAKVKAEEAMKNKESITNMAIAESELRKALLELKVASRKKSPKVQI